MNAPGCNIPQVVDQGSVDRICAQSADVLRGRALSPSDLLEPDLSEDYAEMAADEQRESEASEWSDTLISDVAGPAMAPRLWMLQDVCRRSNAPGNATYGSNS